MEAQSAEITYTISSTRLVLTPDNFAAFLFPPIANTYLPKVVVFRMIRPIATTMTRSTIGIGIAPR